MLAASLRREVQRATRNMLPSRMQSRVPRCLFGPHDPNETAEMLQDALDIERNKFTSRWGIDPCAEDKENFQIIHERVDARSPRKNRGTPYSRQTTINDYWRARKASECSKKGLSILESPTKQSKDQKGLSPKSAKLQNFGKSPKSSK